MSQGQEAAGPSGVRGLGRKERAVAASLAIYAVIAPLGTSAITGLGSGPLPPFVGTVALGLSLLGPGLAAIVVALRGLGTIGQEIAASSDREPQQAISRIFISGAVLVYIGILAATGTPFERFLPLLAVNVPGILGAWLLFVHLLGWPGAARPRRVAAMASDIAFISLFLHFGGDLAAPWVSAYFWVIFGFGFRFGLRPLIAATLLSALAFAGVFLTTPFWRGAPAIAAGIGIALIVLPGYAAALIRRLADAKAEAEEAFAAKSRFLAVMGHELRTPLNTLVGMSALIARTNLDDEQRSMLSTMDLSVRTLHALISDLLDLSKLEAGKLKPAAEGFVLHEVLGAAVALLRPQAEAKGLALTLHLDPRLPHAYRGLPLQLRQVAMNLIANAIKFTEHGRVSVSASQARRAGRIVTLRLAVRDEGVGIPPEARERIFDIFTQADETVTRRFGGTGLGLSIAKQLVELMGGTIAVQSAVGKGSTFTVEIPLEHDPDSMVRPPDLLGRRIVVVTSDGEFAGTLQAWLKSWRGEPQWEADDDAALIALASDQDAAQPTILVLDGRANQLGALSLAHGLKSVTARYPTIVFIAPLQGSDAIAELGATQLAAVIEAPVSEVALASGILGALAAEQQVAAAGAAEPAPPAPAPAVQPAERPLRVLVADDNAANCKILKNVLEMAGHKVEVATTGEAALAALEKSRFDLALLDVNMPEVSGYDVAKLYRMSHMGEWRMPILALTADATSETERLCREAGMDAVLTKPVETAELLAAVDDIYAKLAAPDRGAASAPPVVTPITAHPRFVAENSEAVDADTVAALRSLGGNEFVEEIVDTFRRDAGRLLEHLRQAVARGDLRDFRELVHSLRSGAANVGGVRLCQNLTALRDVTAKDLRQMGPGYLETIETELARLENALEQAMLQARRG
jgi:two-component system sensor histidine kinase RpfC